MKIIIVGKAGAGKSTVLQVMKGRLDERYRHFSVDDALRQFWFGEDPTPQMVQARENLWAKFQSKPSRDEIRNRAFTDDDFRKHMEAVTRDYVLDYVDRALAGEHVILEYPHIALLHDLHAAARADLIVEITCGSNERKDRLTARGWSAEVIKRVDELQKIDVTWAKALHVPVEKVKAIHTDTHEVYNGSANLSRIVNDIREVDLLHHFARRVGMTAGSYCPMTYGHLQMIEQAAKLVDVLVVVAAQNTTKVNKLGDLVIHQMVQRDVQSLEARNIITAQMPAGMSLAASAKKRNITTMFRGIRNSTDLEYERILMAANQRINPELTTAFLLPSPDMLTVSSSFVRGAMELDDWQLLVEPLVTPETLNDCAIAWRGVRTR